MTGAAASPEPIINISEFLDRIIGRREQGGWTQRPVDMTSRLKLAKHLEQFPEQHLLKKLDLSGIGITEDWKDWW